MKTEDFKPEIDAPFSDGKKKKKILTKKQNEEWKKKKKKEEKFGMARLMNDERFKTQGYIPWASDAVLIPLQESNAPKQSQIPIDFAQNPNL